MGEDHVGLDEIEGKGARAFIFVDEDGVARGGK
jgi:hypothetical protein